MLKFNSRKWHAWISFVLSFPILLVAVSAILIGHSQQLGLREIKIDPGWWPGYREARMQSDRPAAEPRENTQKPFTLARLIRDVHSGEAMFGRDGKWIWDDMVGGSMTFLALTGIYLWWKGQRKMVFVKRSRKHSSAAE